MKIVIACTQDSLRHRLARLIASGNTGCVAAAVADPQEAIKRHRADPVAVVVMGIVEASDLHAAVAISQEDPAPALVAATSLQSPMLPLLEQARINHVLEHVQPERLATALHQAEPLSRAQIESLQAEDPERGRRHILCRRRAGLGLIPVDDVRCFVADHKYVAVQHDEGEDLIEESLCRLEEEFGPRFLRVHRSALVARDSLRGLERDPFGRTHALVDGSDEPVPVSRRRLPAVRRWLRESAGVH